MNLGARILILSLNILLLGFIWWLITRNRPAEVHYENLKFFVGIVVLYFGLDGFRIWLANRYESRLLGYLHRTLKSEGREIEEVPEDHPLRTFYNLFVAILEKLTRPMERPGTPLRSFPSSLLHRVLTDPSTGVREKAAGFLHVLKSVMPNAEIFLFSISGDRIALVDFTGTEEISRNRLNLRGNWLLPFSPRSDFSGKCRKNAEPVFTNELKSDPNLGQFLSETNPNLPIYGALFPIGFEDDVRGLLWIRDGAQAMEALQEHKGNLMFASRMLYEHFDLRGRYLNAREPQFEDLYLHFESQARQYMDLARTENRPVAALLFFVRTHNQEPGPELIAALKELLLSVLPPLSTVTREYGVFHCLCYGLERHEAAVVAARGQDLLWKYLQFGSETGVLPAVPLPEPAGSVNAAAAVTIPSTTQSEKLFDQAREALKHCITAGPNQIRLTQEQT